MENIFKKNSRNDFLDETKELLKEKINICTNHISAKDLLGDMGVNKDSDNEETSE